MKKTSILITLSGIVFALFIVSVPTLKSMIGKYVVQIDLISSGGEEPSTNVGFYIEDWAGRYHGYDMYGEGQELSKDDYSSYGIPKKADAACHSFWAGMGETVYLIQKNNTVEFYSRKEYEDGDPTKYKKVKTVKLK
jgi:hypothetical protein